MNKKRSRLFYMAIGIAVSIVLIIILSLILEQGSFVAILLLDMSSDDQVFTYPFTIQNLMWIILGMGLGELYYRLTCANREYAALEYNILNDQSNAMIMLHDVEGYRLKLRKVNEVHQSYITKVIDECLLYFKANKSVENTHSLLNNMIELELHRLELNYTFLKYISWLLPTTGFIGTVVGIANALSLLKGGGDVSDNMDNVVNSLAMAFNTTIIALCFSAVLVFLIQSVQKLEEEAVNKCSEYCLRNLINRLYIPKDN